MSTTASTTPSRSRWFDWKPKARILPDSAESEPTKPPKPGCVGFEGAASVDSPEIETESVDLERACAVLDRTGVRIIVAISGAAAIGIWSDLEGPEVRAALRTLQLDKLPFCYLDGAGTPTSYKVRRVKGEPVPMSVLCEMEGHPSEPWKVRDRMLSETRRKATTARR
jgi:hypothetical protein